MKRPSADTDWGGRRARVLDPGGREWSFGSYRPGEQLTLRVMRDRKTQDIQITLPDRRQSSVFPTWADADNAAM